MGYEEFRKALLEGLREFYGGDAEVGLVRVHENNGRGYDGLWIALAENGGCEGPVVRLDALYEEHGKDGAAGLEICMEAAINAGEDYMCREEVRHFAGLLTEWESTKGMVYPLLVNAGWNRSLLGRLASKPLLDMAVIYVIRYEGGRCSAKVSKEMLDYYGISLQELHGQALTNMTQDDYRFLSAKDALKE